MSDRSIERQIRRALADTREGAAHPLARPILWACVGVVAAFIIWAAWAKVDEVARGEGKVVPNSRVQVIQSLEGGILAEMLVREGQVVDAGQPLAQLDDTRFTTAAKETASQVKALTAAIARLEAEVLGATTITFPDAIPAGDPVIASEQALFRARRQNLNATLAALSSETGYAQRQLNIVTPLAERGVVSEVEGLRLGKDIAALTGRQTEVRNTYMQEAYAELANKKAELAAQSEILNQRRDQLQRTRLTAPVRARVNEILVTTRGGVVQPGEAIMQLTPVDDQLLVEARVQPRDVAFIREGMPASVKISAYDFTIYGDLPGRVEQISEDTLEEDTPRGKMAYYSVLIRTDRAWLEKNGQRLPIRPGMVAQVDIQSGERSVLSYLLKPLLKARLT
ncbi:HlyD family efflux transporter periplasmic adaptor subunit [Brevundimonas terrae]|jgi:adhesin transport system membrane fusion protein|uniref:HlyD family efflux transporter periplasmic adaptor subunit n=1 Tax=Brevundimonas terrae TaxID=363631 RepID=A0ABP3HS30_9CAUL|nr:HlyD family efflux transporter periplasmic adaptor subunit [Brevundimonas terrae]NIJ27558.1 adhesin transport system membrane fusion protein [Brevundimonas terrae]